MTLMKIMRLLWKKKNVEHRYEYVKETDNERPVSEAPAATAGAVQEHIESTAMVGREENIAFSPQGDLEAYVRGLNVSKEAIERWISAGVLLPEETKVAAKMIRIMCKKK